MKKSVLTKNLELHSETHIERQETQHDCLPSVMGDGDKKKEIAYSEENEILYWAGRLEQRRQDKILLYRHDEPNEPT
jgi:hypothetical protein